MAIDFLKLEIEPEVESLKREEQFRLNAFSTSDSYSGLSALALKIRDLVLMEPNTHPAALDMGVGIKNYMMELADDTTLQSLVNITTEQIEKFLPNDKIQSVDYRYVNTTKIKGVLYLFVYIEGEREDPTSFAISFSNNFQHRSVIVSEVYL